MDLMTLLSSIVYGLFVFTSFFEKGPIKIILTDEANAKNIYFRIFTEIIFLPIIGVIFNTLGYIGKFLLLPFKFLQF